MTNSSQNRHNVLYRAFDKDKKLLYIGISNSFYDRLRSHMAQSEWVEKADYITFEHFYSREEVEEAEKRAIAAELPQYNKQYHPMYQQPKKHWQTITKIYAHLDDFHRLIIKRTQIAFHHLEKSRDPNTNLSKEHLAAMAFHLVFWESYPGEEPSSPCVSCNRMIESDFFIDMQEDAEIAFAVAHSNKGIDFDRVMGEAVELFMEEK